MHCCSRLRLKRDGTRPEPDFVFRRNGRVHLNRRGSQFSRLLAAEMCASAVVMLDTPRSEVVLPTGYPLHSPVSPSLPHPCVTVCHQVSNALYLREASFKDGKWTEMPDVLNRGKYGVNHNAVISYHTGLHVSVLTNHHQALLFTMNVPTFLKLLCWTADFRLFVIQK
jgi:hypothetical protein